MPCGENVNWCSHWENRWTDGHPSESKNATNTQSHNSNKAETLI